MSGKPRTAAEKKAFEEAWDARVEAGWARSGKPAPDTHRATYPPSIIGTRQPEGFCVCDDGRPARDCGMAQHRKAAAG